MMRAGAIVAAGAAGSAAMGLTGRKLQKALLRVVEGDAHPSQLKFAYNPTELSTSKSAIWNRPTTNSMSFEITGSWSCWMMSGRNHWKIWETYCRRIRVRHWLLAVYNKLAE